MFRTATCGELRARDAGREVTLAGWVHRRRDHGGLIFFDLRDRSGITQIVFDPSAGPEALEAASEARSEFVLSVTGIVADRPEGTKNPNLPTGDVEVRARAATILSTSKTPPFPIAEETEVEEGVRLRYRYLDLRRPRMQRNIILRHEIVRHIRDFLEAEGFIDVETPILAKSTPEGARDFLVPSRLNAGSFYALPQSPQQFKQLLMVAGLDRYYQIARCFRDEDSRSERTLEFTQLDLEMSFVDEGDVMALMERMLVSLVERFAPGRLMERPFPRLSYADCMRRYGIDRPDLRFGMELIDVSDRVRESEFAVFRSAVEGGGHVKGIVAPGCAGYSRRELDELTAFARQLGAKGLVTVALGADDVRSPAARFFKEGELRQIVETMGGREGDLALFVADQPATVAKVLGRLRVELGERLGLADPSVIALCWVVDFPLLEWNEDEGRYQAAHNPFSSPKDADYALLETRPQDALAKQYDVVWNGTEIGGGSVRIHQRWALQSVFRAIGLSDEQIEEQFGHMLDAFDHGAPPHGGIAFGIDRLVSLFAAEDNIREVIAFPKNQSGSDPMMGAPSGVDARQLRDLHVALLPEEPASARRA